MIPVEVLTARTNAKSAAEQNARALEPRIAGHLRVQHEVIATLIEAHQDIIDQNDTLDPTEKNQAAATWLLAGRCLSMSQSLTIMLEAGLTTDIAPVARTLHEAGAALRVIAEGGDQAFVTRWLRDGYFSPEKLERAEHELETRMATEMLKQGHPLPGRTTQLSKQIYGTWSKIAHNRRSGILESYSSQLRQMAYGPHQDPLLRAVWVGYGSQLLVEVVLTVGMALTKFLGQVFWITKVEPAVNGLNLAMNRLSLGPEDLGFS
jgi:hypothetical protein